MLWCGLDKQGQPKTSGKNVPSAKQPCLQYEMPTFYVPSSRRYNLPSKVLQSSRKGRDEEPQFVQCYSPWKPAIRDPEESIKIMRFISEEDGQDTSDGVVAKETGIKRKALIFEPPSMVPYHSFPVYTMHLGYGIAQNLIVIFKGESKQLLATDGYPDEDIVIDEGSCEAIDREMLALGSGPSQCASGSRHRDRSTYCTRRGRLQSIESLCSVTG